MEYLMLFFNLIAVLSNIIFVICLKNLPKDFSSYIDGFELVIVMGLITGPFIINCFLLRSASLTKSIISLVLLLLLLAIDLFCLIFLYKDQLVGSRGFALVACVPIYLFGFLPIWLCVLYTLKK